VPNWSRLVATLGSKSSLKTVTRKTILDVDVHKACDTIQNPEAPMALRLQGNLLYVVIVDFSCSRHSHLTYLIFGSDMAWPASILSNAVMSLRTHRLSVTKSVVFRSL
jgi:N terminus of Rad21 / Rec8 like protein